MIKTDEQIIELAKKVWAEHKHPTRRVFMSLVGAGQERLERLHEAGLIVYPAKVPKNKCHLFNNQTKWRKFRLKGSPTFKETENGKL